MAQREQNTSVTLELRDTAELERAVQILRAPNRFEHVSVECFNVRISQEFLDALNAVPTLISIRFDHTRFYEAVPTARAPDGVRRTVDFFMCAMSATFLRHGLPRMGIYMLNLYATELLANESLDGVFAENSALTNVSIQDDRGLHANTTMHLLAQISSSHVRELRLDTIQQSMTDGLRLLTLGRPLHLLVSLRLIVLGATNENATLQSVLANALHHLPNLSSLYLQNMFLSESELAAAFADRDLEKLSMVRVHLNADFLSTVLASSTRMAKLFMMNMRISSELAQVIARFIDRSDVLQSLEMYESYTTNVNDLLINQAIARSTSLILASLNNGLSSSATFAVRRNEAYWKIDPKVRLPQASVRVAVTGPLRDLVCADIAEFAAPMAVPAAERVQASFAYMPKRPTTQVWWPKQPRNKELFAYAADAFMANRLDAPLTNLLDAPIKPLSPAPVPFVFACMDDVSDNDVLVATAAAGGLGALIMRLEARGLSRNPTVVVCVDEPTRMQRAWLAGNNVRMADPDFSDLAKIVKAQLPPRVTFRLIDTVFELAVLRSKLVISHDTLLALRDQCDAAAVLPPSPYILPLSNGGAVTNLPLLLDRLYRFFGSRVRVMRAASHVMQAAGSRSGAISKWAGGWMPRSIAARLFYYALHEDDLAVPADRYVVPQDDALALMLRHGVLDAVDDQRVVYPAWPDVAATLRRAFAWLLGRDSLQNVAMDETRRVITLLYTRGIISLEAQISGDVVMVEPVDGAMRTTASEVERRDAAAEVEKALNMHLELVLAKRVRGR